MKINILRYMLCKSVSKRIYKKIFVFAIFVILAISHMSSAATWPSSSTSSTIFEQQETFVEASSSILDGVKVGAKSNNLYFLYNVNVGGVDNSVIRWVNAGNNAIWTAAFNKTPLLKSLSIDLDEDNLYFAWNNDPINVFRLRSDNGAMVSVQQ